jgi:hypothetical protein
MFDGQTELESFAKLFAEVIAEAPHKAEAELCHTIEIRYRVSMAPPERRALLARVYRRAKANGHGATDAPSLASAGDAGVFTGPGIEGNLQDFEAPTPPGKSAGHQKLDQLNPQRKDHEQRAGARRKTIDMSEKAEGAAGRDAPQKTTTMSDAANFTASAESSKAENSPHGAKVHDAPSLAGDAEIEYHEVDDTDAELAAFDYAPDEPAPSEIVEAALEVDNSRPENGADYAARLHALFAGNEAEHVVYSDPEPERQGSNGVKFKPRYTTVPGAVTVEHLRQHLAGDRPLGIIPIRGDNMCLFGSADVDEYDANPLQVIEKIERAKLPLVATRSKSGGLHLNLFVQEWSPRPICRSC